VIEEEVEEETEPPILQALPPNQLMPEAVSDVSVESTIVEDVNMEDISLPSITSKIIAGATKRGKDQLVDNHGFRYNLKRKLKNSVHWQCTNRPVGRPCKAIVIEHPGLNFQEAGQGHNHEANVGTAAAVQAAKEIKELAVRDLFKPAAVIVNEVTIYNSF
jgi:hypothetical protein